MSEIMLKHWTEPRGILAIQVPVDWQYRNPVIGSRTEEPPYSFEPYENPLGCFQLSCYPYFDLVPNASEGFKPKRGVPSWTRSRIESDRFDVCLYYGAKGDQALIGKYIYDRELRGDSRVSEQLKIVDSVLASIIVIPINDRALAANLDKYDRFLGSLCASYDLLYAAIESESFVEIVVISTSQIDALLRQSIIVWKQLASETDDFDSRYFFQSESDSGIRERAIFQEALDLGIIEIAIYDRLQEVYKLRNRIVHRYMISPIQTRDIIPIVTKLLELHEVIRVIARNVEDRQVGKGFGIFGRGFQRLEKFTDIEYKQAHSWANDKHGLEKFRRQIGREET